MTHAKFILLLLLGGSTTARAVVDMKSANYSETWSDLVVPGIGYDLRINRTYNSRTLFNGLFGFGWCSDFETKIDVTPESNLRLTECGGGTETVFTPKNFKPQKIDNTVAMIMTEVRKRRPELKSDYIEGLESELKSNDFMREEFSHRMNIKGKVDDGVVYYANGHEAENIAIKAGVYKRTMADGTSQYFDVASGHMTYMSDKNSNYLKLSWERDSLQSVSDNLGRKLTFKYNTTKKVSDVVGPNSLTSHFAYKGEDLVDVTDAKQAKYHYSYDDVHNLIRIDYQDKTFKALTYNKDKDWVTSFRNRKGCIETYDYQVSKEDPKNHFWSNVNKKCGDKITNQSKYEFFHKPHPEGGGVYLYRVRSEVNGSVTDIVYHEVFGKPISMTKDAVHTEYSYYDNGMLKSKKEPGRTASYEYKNSCNKLSQITVQMVDEGSESSPRKPSQAKGDKVGKVSRTHFTYDQQKCNLVQAETSEGVTVKLQYDPQGRIALMEDQAKKIVKIQYENRFGKPSIVTRPGIGAIQVSYKADGEILKVESREGLKVADQVAGIFNNLLDVISPATSEISL